MADFGTEFFEGGPGGRGRHRGGRRIDGETLRLIILYLLADGPRHGYDLIKAIEERTTGHYSPSPGVVYPALTYLEEADFTQSRTEGTKKVYEITEAGRAHLEDNRQAAETALEGLELFGRKMEFARKRVEEKLDRARQRIDEAEERFGWGTRDRDIPNVVPELNAARRALKSAMAAVIAEGPDAQRRAADILSRAAAEIRPDTDADDIDI